jgi:hypothetical protein
MGNPMMQDHQAMMQEIMALVDIHAKIIFVKQKIDYYEPVMVDLQARSQIWMRCEYLMLAKEDRESTQGT